MCRFLLFTLLLSCLAACSDDDGPGPQPTPKTPPTTAGINFLETATNPATVFGSLRTAVAADPANDFVVEIDHSQNATQIGLELAPTLSLHFSDAVAETTLLQENQQAALDLPLKVAFYQAPTAESYFLYNSTQYLANRHGLSSSLLDLGIKLEDLVAAAANDDATLNNNSQVSRDQGILSRSSNQDFNATYADLLTAIAAETDMEIRAEWDFAQRANAIGEDLPPTRLVLLGNPNWDHILLRGNQTVAIDLPFALLVSESLAGQVSVAYNLPIYIAGRHDINPILEEITLMDDALSRIAAAATGN